MGGFLVTAQNLLNSAPILGEFIGTGFRPPQWAGPQLTSITVTEPGSPGQAGTSGTLGEVASHNITYGDVQVPGTSTTPTLLTPKVLGTPAIPPTLPQSTTYFFDAVFRVDHDQEMRITEHPIQSGAAISDHAYLIPARVSLEIGMSDVMASFVAGQYTDFATKSISAYQKLLSLQSMRIPLTLTTRLNTYENMLIEDVRAGDDIRTLHGLRAQIRMRQIIVGQVSTTAQSARPNASTSSNPGTSQPQAVGQAISQSHLDPSSGQWNSNAPISTVPPPSN